MERVYFVGKAFLLASRLSSSLSRCRILLKASLTFSFSVLINTTFTFAVLVLFQFTLKTYSYSVNLDMLLSGQKTCLTEGPLHISEIMV